MLALPGSSDFFPLPLSARKPALFSVSAPSLEHCLFLSFFCLCLLSPGPPLSHHTVLPSYLAFLTWSSSLACLHFLISYRRPLILSDFFFLWIISYTFSNFFFPCDFKRFPLTTKENLWGFFFLFCFAYWLAGAILKSLQTVPFVVLNTSAIWISTTAEESWGCLLPCPCDLRVNIKLSTGHHDTIFKSFDRVCSTFASLTLCVVSVVLWASSCAALAIFTYWHSLS